MAAATTALLSELVTYGNGAMLLQVRFSPTIFTKCSCDGCMMGAVE
jgi:hypothetical protein